VPREWHSILARNVPAFRRLPLDDQAELLGHMHVLIAEKHFEGAGGLALTDEVVVTIAAQACLPLLHRETQYYPELTTILVYPGGYTERGEWHVGGGVWEEGEEDRLGHTAQGLRALVLAWDEVKRGAAHPADGRNLVLHEFAHQLDFEDRHTDGTPAFRSAEEYRDWARVAAREFEALRLAVDSGVPTVLDTYGASDRAEFFAVATETFFERPRALKARHPELYTLLQQYFKQNPAEWSAESGWDELTPSGD
jgi:Mlc titration factor MtfA (ptsG expression regulator)